MRLSVPRLAVVALLSLTSATIGATQTTDWVEIKTDPGDTTPPLRVAGTVQRLPIEGGVWIIRDTAGTRYQPTNLPDAFKVDGMTIEAEARRAKNVVSIGMAAPLLNLVRIRQRPGTAVVSGTVSYKERMALPADAVIEVELADVSKADAAARVIARTTVSPDGRQVPIPFELSYDPSAVSPNGTYAVRAVIRSGGQMLFTTDTRYLVITGGRPSRVNLVLVRPKA
jgi:putative lipoprotein